MILPGAEDTSVLIGCEISGTVRDAFLARGFDAWSNDIQPDERGSNRHIRGDIRDQLGDPRWKLIIVAHPPCTRLCNSGVRWLSSPPPGRTREEMWAELDAGAELFSTIWNADVAHLAVENPVMHRYAKERIVNFRKADQTVQPHWFGEPQFKATGWYLRELPTLEATDRLTPPAPGTAEHKLWSRVHRMPGGRRQAKERSRFFPGMAAAAADQWGRHILGLAPSRRLFGRPQAFRPIPHQYELEIAA